MSPDHVRLFIGAYPPPPVIARLSSAIGEVRALPKSRLTSPSAVHLTILFIGEFPRSQLAELTESTARIAQRSTPSKVVIDRLITLPPRRPRLIAAAGAPSARLTELRDSLAEDLESGNRFSTAEKDLLPHLTLCRFARGVRAQPLDLPIEPIEFDVSEVQLVESVLESSGARHLPLASFELTGSDDR